MNSWPTRRLRHGAVVTMLIALVAAWNGLGVRAAFQDPDPAPGDTTLEALSGSTWSRPELFVAPGSVLTVTNRDVDRHSFVVDAWNVHIDLPSLKPMEVPIPEDAEIGSTVEFYSDVDEDRERGMAGTIHIVEPADTATTPGADGEPGRDNDRLTITIQNDYQFDPSTARAYAGAMLEIRNDTAQEHHFVIDAWQINETVSPGNSKLVQVPDAVKAGDRYDFYCSVPGHKAMGMQGTIEIVEPPRGLVPAQTGNPGLLNPTVNARRFLPLPTEIGSGWTTLLEAPANTIVSYDRDMAFPLFPDAGGGAVYLGPNGSRAIVLVLPLGKDVMPSSQSDSIVNGIQASMIDGWSRDRISSVAINRLPPPDGCDTSLRVNGIVNGLTLPGGSTVCELRSAGVTIFVTVEGEIDGLSGYAASDGVIDNILETTI